MQLQREEAEFEQRYFFGRGGQFAVGGNQIGNGGNGMDEEEARAERTTRMSAVLKATSFVSYFHVSFERKFERLDVVLKL